jgi:nitrate reductase delta subunit
MRLCRIRLKRKTSVGEEPMQDERRYFKLVSLLLQYPDEAWFGALPELKSVVDAMPEGRRKTAIEAFIADLEGHSALEVQTQYTALFDMSPSTTLNVTYHLWGDGEKRARLLSRLQQTYTRAGFERTSSELPDFLPMMLEFMAAVPRVEWSEPIQKSLETLDTLIDRLKPVAAPYSGLLEPLRSISGAKTQPRTAADAI